MLFSGAGQRLIPYPVGDLRGLTRHGFIFHAKFIRHG